MTEIMTNEEIGKLEQDCMNMGDLFLLWRQVGVGAWEADIGNEKDGCRFTLTHHPTCYRRGPWRLLIEIRGGIAHHSWGCFDDQDQPLRYYHIVRNARDEAYEIAKVLIKDRAKNQEGLEKLMNLGSKGD